MSYFTRNKTWAIAFLLLIALNVATLATFWLVKERRPGPPPVPQSGVVDFLTNELGFDSVQKKELIRLHESHQEKMREVRKNNREAKDAFFALLQQHDIPDSVIENAAKESAKHDSETDVLTFRHFQQVRNLCNETQKKKFDSVIQQVLRMIAPPQGKPQGPPPHRGEGGPDGPPPGDDRREPPPPPQQ
jgi:protein CpxP